PWRPRTRSAGPIPAQLTATCSPPASVPPATAPRTLPSAGARGAQTRAPPPAPPCPTPRRAVAAPRPDPPPVTSTVLPVSSTVPPSAGGDEPGRLVARLPLEAAAHARAVGLGDRLALEDPVEGVAQQGAGDRIAVAGGAVVEGAPAGGPADGGV